MPEPERRRLIGIAGAPGAGKSTYAMSFATGLEVPAAYVPMDGFHLADATLRELGLIDRKGAPETFDAWGFAALLHRLRRPEPHTVYAPGFERDLEQALAGAIAVDPETQVVVTEGNYLLLDRPEWRAVRAELDEVWFLEADETLRTQRLAERHVAFGKTPAQAAAWVASVDEPNARLVGATRDRADRVIRL